jgi:DNA topoisomerase-1
MEITRIRIGNDTYAEENNSFGLTTIHNNHAKVDGSKIKFKFRGKSGVLHEVTFQDRRLSKIIRRCQDLPGEELFAYEDENG